MFNKKQLVVCLCILLAAFYACFYENVKPSERKHLPEQNSAQKESPHKPKPAEADELMPIEIIHQIPTQRKSIALTFDDGPDPVFTGQVLKVLRKHHASATFFLIGHHAEQYPKIAAQIVSDGNETGVHSYDHKALHHLPCSEVQNQVNKTYDIIYKATSHKPVLFRPPFGFYNNSVLKAAGEKKMKMILWTPEADPKDYKNPGTSRIVKQLVRNAKPGMIILLHDSGRDRKQTVAAIDRVMTILEVKGYRFQTVSDILKNKN